MLTSLWTLIFLVCCPTYISLIYKWLFNYLENKTSFTRVTNIFREQKNRLNVADDCDCHTWSNLLQFADSLRLTGVNSTTGRTLILFRVPKSKKTMGGIEFSALSYSNSSISRTAEINTRSPSGEGCLIFGEMKPSSASVIFPKGHISLELKAKFV